MSDKKLASRIDKRTAVVGVVGMGYVGLPLVRTFCGAGFYCLGYDIDERKVGETIHGAEIRHPSNLAAADGVPILIAVGSERARDVIRPQLETRGYRIGVDAWFVA